MGPKEKAIQLISMHGDNALIVANEIIDEIRISKYISWIRERKEGEEFLVYWYEVIYCLNNLQKKLWK